MANVIDIIVSKQAQAELDKVIASLKLTHEEIIKINQQGLKINSGASPKNPVQMNQSVKETIALNEKLDTTNKKLVVTAKQMEQASIKESNARNSLNKQREQSLNLLAKEEAKLNAASNLYSKVQAKINSLTAEYQNLATRKELGLALTAKEEQKYTSLQGRIQNYDKTLKAVDANMGKYQRNVGNYASGFNPLSNSINQLGREMPAFTNSVQTGFMAISNNLPIFFDAMGQVIAQNKELQAQGKPTKSVLSQLASSLFSFQTLLSIGVTLLTVYGKELVEWATGLTNAEKALRSFKQAQIEIQSQSVAQAKDLDKYRDVVNNTNISEKERLRALKLLKEQIPELSKVELGRADALQKVNQYTDYYIKQAAIRYRSDQFIKKAGEELIKQEEIRLKVQKGQVDVGFGDYIKGAGAAMASNNLIATSTYASANALSRLNEEYEASVLAQKNFEKSAEIEIQQLDVVKTSRLEKAKILKEKIDLNFREIESEYDLKRAILERQKAEISDRMDNESLNLNDRLKAREEFSKKSIELLDLELRKEKEVLLFKQAEDFSKNNLALKNKEISYAQYSENIKDINKRVSNEIATSDLAYSLKWNDLLNSDAEFYKKIQEQKLKFTQDTNKLILDSETKKFEKISKDETKTLLTRNLAHQKYIDNSKQQLQIDKMLEMSKSTSQEQLDNIIKKYQLLGEALDDLATPYENARKGFEDYLKSITGNELDSALNKIGMSSLKMFLDIDENGQNTFSKMWELAETTQEKFALAFKGIGDVFQEVAGLMSQASQKRYEEELYRLEQQKNVSLQFAGESAIAKEEIEKQYEQRKKEIQRREAEATKRLAIFNIAIDTAQAIMAAAPKIPLMVAMGVLGAAQIAMVSSQSIPEFWKGTDNAPEGLAWTQEKGAEVITDKKGNIKTLGNNKGAQLTYLEKGDKVYKSQQDYINKTLVGAGIQPMRENNSLTSSDFNNGISKLAKTMQSNKGNNTQVFLNNKQINTDYSKGKNV